MDFKHFSFSLLFLFSFIIYTNASYTDCVYNIYVQTGDIPSAGTHSNISIFLIDETKAELSILNLKEWGLTTGSASNYFKKGNLDIFSGRAPCLRGPVCSLIVVLEGFDDWYCDFLEVTVVGLEKSCSQKHFVVKKWIDNNRGTAVILQDECSSDDVRSWWNGRSRQLEHSSSSAQS